MISPNDNKINFVQSSKIPFRNSNNFSIFFDQNGTFGFFSLSHLCIKSPLRPSSLGELITMAGLDDAFTNPLDELRETSLTMANGSNVNHPSGSNEKNEERSSSSSSSSSSSETNNKTNWNVRFCLCTSILFQISSKNSFCLFFFFFFVCVYALLISMILIFNHGYTSSFDDKANRYILEISERMYNLCILDSIE